MTITPYAPVLSVTILFSWIVVRDKSIQKQYLMFVGKTTTRSAGDLIIYQFTLTV